MTSTQLVERFAMGHSLRMLAEEMGANADEAERSLRDGLWSIAEEYRDREPSSFPAPEAGISLPPQAQVAGASSPRPALPKSDRLGEAILRALAKGPLTTSQLLMQPSIIDKVETSDQLNNRLNTLRNAYLVRYNIDKTWQAI